MLERLGPLSPSLILAHPLTQHGALPISPLTAALLGSGVVALVALRRTGGPVSPGAPSNPRLYSYPGALSPIQLLTRCVAVGLLVLAIAAGRLGAPDELDNLAPALLVGAAWPLLVLFSLVTGSVWRWLDPWDTVTRPVTPPEEGVPTDVYWAVPATLAWTWYLSAYTGTLSPRSVGAAAAVYSIVTIAGCLAVGRGQWLGRAEPFGLILTWNAHLARRRLTEWRPAAGVEVVLGVLAGGMLFGSLRLSELWGRLNVTRRAELYALGGLAVSCGVAAGLLWSLRRWEGRRDRDGDLAASVVPGVAGLVVAIGLERNRLFTSLQLLPALAGDPFGEGWDLLGEAGTGLVPAPLGVTGLALAQLFVITAGHVAGAWVLGRRRVDVAKRLPGLVGLCVLEAVGVVALTVS